MSEEQKAAQIVKSFVQLGSATAFAIGGRAVNGHDVADFCRKAIEQFPDYVKWPAVASAADKRAAKEASDILLTAVGKMCETIQAAHDQADAARAVAENN